MLQRFSGRLVGDLIDALRLSLAEIAAGTGLNKWTLAKYRLPPGRGRKMPVRALERLIALAESHIRRLQSLVDAAKAEVRRRKRRAEP